MPAMVRTHDPTGWADKIDTMKTLVQQSDRNREDKVEVRNLSGDDWTLRVTQARYVNYA